MAAWGMESLTHVVLGAALGVATMGRRVAPWKAARWGAACNTLPDLDVFIDHGDAVSNMVLHRGHSHSLFWLTLLAPLLALASARAQGLSPQHVLVTPAPLTTLLWRVVLVQDGHYHEGFRSLLDRAERIDFEAFDRGAALAPLLRPVAAAQRIRAFSHGFYKLSRTGEELLVTDLRMGQEPQYVFGFVVARQEIDGQVRPLRPWQVSGRIDTDRGLAWLLPRMLGHPLPPPR
jgi:hypothetical protein